MTIETFNDDNYTDFESKLAWLIKRMNQFHTKARLHATRADFFEKEFTRELNDDGEAPAVGYRARMKDHYDKAVAANQMYDRWTLREAAIIQAMCAAQQARLVNETKELTQISKR